MLVLAYAHAPSNSILPSHICIFNACYIVQAIWLIGKELLTKSANLSGWQSLQEWGQLALGCQSNSCKIFVAQLWKSRTIGEETYSKGHYAWHVQKLEPTGPICANYELESSSDIIKKIMSPEFICTFEITWVDG
jgi:hypothetical protein